MHQPLLVQFHPRVELEEVLEAVKIAYESAGCAPCGRLSLFLHAQDIVDPALERLRRLPSLVNVSELAPQIALATSPGR